MLDSSFNVLLHCAVAFRAKCWEVFENCFPSVLCWDPFPFSGNNRWEKWSSKDQSACSPMWFCFSKHGFQKPQTRSTLAFRAMPILNRGWWNPSSSKKGSSLSNVILTYSNRFHVVVHIVVAPQTFSLKWFLILRNTWQLSSRNGTTPVHRLSLELQLGSIDFMGAE